MTVNSTQKTSLFSTRFLEVEDNFLSFEDLIHSTRSCYEGVVSIEVREVLLPFIQKEKAETLFDHNGGKVFLFAMRF